MTDIQKIIKILLPELWAMVDGQNSSDKYLVRFYLFVSDFTPNDKKILQNIQKVKKCELIFCDIDYCDSFSIPHYTAEDIKQAFNYPKIYHYAGGNKPWINAKIKHAYNVWWAYAKKSPWYRQIKETCNKRKKEITYLQLFSLFPLLSWEKKQKSFGKVIKVKLFNLLPLLKITVK
jgi:lipopolysaccharide biosynthesis glycosyltransferase